MTVSGNTLETGIAYRNRLIEIYNAEVCRIENIDAAYIGSVVKINFQYNATSADEQNQVGHLITNNINSNHTNELMHICNVNKWDAKGLKACHTYPVDTSKGIIFYLRPRIYNASVTDIYAEDCTGDVFHFNRYDNSVAIPAMGTEGYVSHNIRFNNVTAYNVGNFVGFNSEESDVTFDGVYCDGITNGFAVAYNGRIGNLVVRNFTIKNTARLCVFENSDYNQGTGKHEKFDLVSFNHGEILGQFQKTNIVCGEIGVLELSDIRFIDVNNDLIESAQLVALIGIEKVIMRNIYTRLGNQMTALRPLIQFSKGTASELYVDGVVVDTEEEFSNFVVDSLKIAHVYLTSVFATGVRSIYYASSSASGDGSCVCTNCYINHEAVN